MALRAAGGEAEAARQFTWRTIQTWHSRYKKDGITTMAPRRQFGAQHKSDGVDIAVQHSGDYITLYVHDDGPGIAPSRCSSLFEPFSNSSHPNGTGFGLCLCRRYVGLFGGSVSVGEGPLGGAAFTIMLC